MGSFLAYGGTLEPYLSQFDVEKLEMASVMGICAGLVEPKSENVEKVWVFKAFLNGQRCDEDPGAGLRRSGPDRLGGGRGRVNPPPRRLFWRFWRFGGLMVQGLYTPRGQRPRRIQIASRPPPGPKEGPFQPKSDGHPAKEKVGQRGQGEPKGGQFGSRN